MAQKTPAELASPIVKRLIKFLADNGWHAYSVDDGGDYPVELGPDYTAHTAVMAVDDAVLFVHKGASYQWVRLITANGEDVVSDWTTSDRSFDSLLETFTEE